MQDPTSTGSLQLAESLSFKTRYYHHESISFSNSISSQILFGIFNDIFLWKFEINESNTYTSLKGWCRFQEARVPRDECKQIHTQPLS